MTLKEKRNFNRLLYELKSIYYKMSKQFSTGGKEGKFIVADLNSLSTIVKYTDLELDRNGDVVY